MKVFLIGGRGKEDTQISFLYQPKVENLTERTYLKS